AYVIEHTLEPSGRLAEETADHCLVSDNKERHRETLGDRLAQGCFAIPRRAHKKNLVSWLQRVRAQHASSLLFLDELRSGSACNLRQDEFAKLPPRHDLGDILVCLHPLLRPVQHCATLAV